MDINIYRENLDEACEKFRAILEKQLYRIEDMKSQGDFTDYSTLDTVRIALFVFLVGEGDELVYDLAV